MATITLSSPAFFQNGTGGVSAVVGYANHANRVARYSFTAPQSGASSVSLSLSGLVLGDPNGIRPQTLRFYIGTDPNSHINAGASTDCTGLMHLGADKVSFSGSADVLLLPNTAYYLFLFPNSTEYGWFSLELATAVLTTAGGSFSLPTLSASTVTMGEAVTVRTNRHSSDFTHTITYVFGSASGTVAEGVTDSVSWTPPLELARQIPNAALGVGSVYCTTYSGTTQIGSPQPVTVYLAVPEDVVPTAALSITDSAGAYDKLGVYAQNVTRLSVSVTGAGAYGSTVTATSVALDGSPYSGGVITSAGSHTLTATVTDSRGRRGTASQRFTVAAYEKPSLTLTASRCDAQGAADDSGGWAKITAVCTTGEAGANAASLALCYGDGEETVPLEAGTVTKTWIVAADTESTLAISATLSDSLAGTSRAMTLSTAFATLDFLKGGKGIAFGAVAEREGFTCAMDAEFLGKVKGTIFDAIYPVGSIYMSVSSTSPDALFGGTWERIEGRFLVGASTAYPLGSAGGSGLDAVFLSAVKYGGISAGGDYAGRVLVTHPNVVNSNTMAIPLKDCGVDTLPPYLAVCIWKRTA